MNTISINELHKKFQNLPADEIILDIRTTDEYAEGHIPGSKNIPLDRVVGAVNELKKYKTVYVHCRSGGRVQSAYSLLKPMGLTNLVCIVGQGFPDWEDAGFEVEK